jgi:protein-S-isoprenylcysteine O-methyltransferase Ste14
MTFGPEAPFKIAFLVMFAAVAVIATRTAKRAARVHGGGVNQLQHEARGLIAIRGALGLAFYAMLMVWLFRREPLEWTRLPVVPFVRWIAVGLMPLGIALFAWGFASIGDQFRGGVGLYDDHRLVTTGAYRFVRHPIYLSFIVLMLVAAVVSANWVIAAAGLALVSIIPLIRIPIEERELAERFSSEWTRYRDATGCFLPRAGNR